MKKIVKVTASALAMCLLVTGCGNNAELKDNNTVVKTDEGKISADTLYEELRDKYGISVLVDMIDHQLFDEKYETDDEEEETINAQIEQMKSQYNNDDEAFLAAIQQYLGVENEDELKEMLSLEYKRNLAIEDYVKDSVTDDEIQKYYDDEVIGDIKVRHILIKPDTTDDMSTEEQTEAEEKAKKEAEDLIKKLDDGADFEELAKEYSDDTGSASDGGLIDYFNKDDNMDEAFLNASIDLEEGKYTEEPVQSSFGYHIILKLDQKKKPKLKEVRDDSDKNGVSIVMELETDKDLEIIKNFLYKKTQLQISYSANIILIKDRKPCQTNIIQIIDSYIEHANDIIIRSSTFDLKKALNRKEILEGLIKAIKDVDKLVKLIKSSKSKDEAKQKIMSSFKLNENQAEAVVNLRLYVLTSYDTEKLVNEYNELLKFIDIKKRLIEDQNYRNQFLIDKLNIVISSNNTNTMVFFNNICLFNCNFFNFIFN